MTLKTGRFVRVASLAVVATLLVGGTGVWVWQERSAARLSAETERHARAFRARRWTRPVLRGTAVPGNSAAAIHDVLVRSRLTWRDLQPCWQVTYDQAPEPARLVRIERTLDALRRATQRGWSWAGTGELELVDEAGGFEHAPGRFDHDARLLDQLLTCDLRLARLRSPSECMRTLADDIRVAQDLVAGGTEDALEVELELTRSAVDGIARCASRASLAERGVAARELAILAEHPASLESVVARRFVSRRLALRRAFDEAKIYVRDVAGYPLGLRQRLLDALEHDARAAERWASVASSGADPVRLLNREIQAEPLTFGYGPRPLIEVSFAALEHLRTRAKVRALAMALAASTLAPERDAELARSPFVHPSTGQPLELERIEYESMSKTYIVAGERSSFIIVSILVPMVRGDPVQR